MSQSSMPNQTRKQAVGGESWQVDRRGLDLLKRSFDISAAAFGLLLLSPLLALIALLVKRDSRGPAFYRGRRAGRGGREFRILKFRTMYETPESYAGAPITAQDDQRITPLGHFLRNSKLNELPQLWNVLVGDMSLVGPRPEDPEIAARWPAEVRAEILSVRPGITSPASLQYRHEELLLANPPPQVGKVKPANLVTGQASSEPALRTYIEYIVPDKLRLDQLYVRHRSFWLDIDTLIYTFVLLLPRLEQATPRESWLFLGPLSRFMRRYLNWFIIDAAVSFAAVAAAGVFFRTFGPLHVGELQAAGVALAFALIFSLTGAIMGVHRIHWSNAAPEDAFMLIPVVMVATLLALVANRSWTGDPLMPRGMVLLSGLLAFLGFVAVRYRWRLLRSLARRLFKIDVSAINARERVLIIGSGEAGQFVAYLLNQRRTENALSIIGFVDDDLYQQGSSCRGLDVVGSRKDIPHLVEKHDIGVIVFAIHNIDPQEQEEILELCAATPARIVYVPDLGAMVGEIVNGRGGRR
jgi:lipopolysaccharide/colanic/teichoic acid biosynthesis glycosyltransferase